MRGGRPPELRRRVICILLECFLVLKVVSSEYYRLYLLCMYIQGNTLPVMVFGFIFAGVCFLFFGPSPLFGLQDYQ